MDSAPPKSSEVDDNCDNTTLMEDKWIESYLRFDQEVPESYLRRKVEKRPIDIETADIDPRDLPFADGRDKKTLLEDTCCRHIKPYLRFDQELPGSYLRRKVEKRPIDIELVEEADIDPGDLPDLQLRACEKKSFFIGIEPSPKSDFSLVDISSILETVSMESDPPKPSQVADGRDMKTLLEDIWRRHIKFDQELPGSYLRRKVEKRPIDIELIEEADIDPGDLPGSTTDSRTIPQLNCPRCESPNTKFCYYNNCNIYQPRHFCKTCRRYWAETGALRNILSSTSTVSECVASAATTSKNKSENILKGANKPTYYSTATLSGRNYTSIPAAKDDPPQPSNQHPALPDMRIDILNHCTELIIQQSWKEYKDKLKNSKFDDDALKIMNGTLTMVVGQVIGGVMVQRITSFAANSYSWAGPALEIATVLGLCATLVGISLRGRSRALMIKIGGVITVSAIVFSMGLHLKPELAWTVGLVAFLIMAVSTAFA